MRVVPLLLICATVLAGEDVRVSNAYEHFYNLRYDRAVAEFQEYARERPDDPAAYNHVAEAILYKNLFRAGALETELVTGNNPFLRRAKVNATAADQKAFDEAIRRAINLSQARLARNNRDASAHYLLGVSYGLRANYNFLVRKAWRDSLRDATAARKTHGRATEIDPGFIDARMVQGLHEYIVGSLPLHLKLLGFLVGFRGNRAEGLRTVEYVAEHGSINRIDAQFLLCAIYRREKTPQLAVPLLQRLIRRFPQNYLLRMELAQMYSELGERPQAIATLEELRRLKQSGVPDFAGLPMERICFAEGNLQFWFNDLDSALGNLQRAAAGAEDLDLNTGVLAWMRLGQVYDLKGQRAKALDAYRHAVRFAPDSEAARESEAYLDTPYRRKSTG